MTRTVESTSVSVASTAAAPALATRREVPLIEAGLSTNACGLTGPRMGIVGVDGQLQVEHGTLHLGQPNFTVAPNVLPGFPKTT